MRPVAQAELQGERPSPITTTKPTRGLSIDVTHSTSSSRTNKVNFHVPSDSDTSDLSDLDEDEEDSSYQPTTSTNLHTRPRPSTPASFKAEQEQNLHKRTRRGSPPPQPVASGSGTSQHHHLHQAPAASTSSTSTSYLSRPSASSGSSRPSYPMPPPLHANPPQLASADQKCHFCWHTGAGPYVDLPFANGVHITCEGCAEWYEVEVQTALLTGGSVEDVTRRLVAEGMRKRKGKGRSES